MKDLISREQALKAVSWDTEAYMAINNVPSAEKTGEWIWDDEGFHCSECWYHAYENAGEILSENWHYCPHCGARMVEE